jgi:hypothetical protein
MAAPSKVVPLVALRVDAQVLPLRTAKSALDAADEQRRRRLNALR